MNIYTAKKKSFRWEEEGGLKTCSGPISSIFLAAA